MFKNTNQVYFLAIRRHIIVPFLSPKSNSSSKKVFKYNFWVTCDLELINIIISKPICFGGLGSYQSSFRTLCAIIWSQKAFVVSSVSTELFSSKTRLNHFCLFCYRQPSMSFSPRSIIRKLWYLNWGTDEFLRLQRIW